MSMLLSQQFDERSALKERLIREEIHNIDCK